MSDQTINVDAQSAPASAAHNKAVCRKWIEDFNDREWEAEAAARTADYVAYAPASIDVEPLDPDGWTAMLGVFLEGFPDLQISIEDVVGDERLVAQRFRFTGTHTGVFQGLPATNKPIDFTGVEFNRMVDGKIAEHWFELDQVTMMQQLGLKVVPGLGLLPKILAQTARRPFAGSGTASTS